jgi:cytochrome c-type biogenesis protein CcsB
VLDIAARPEAYADRNIIRIKSVPLRQDLQRLDFLPVDEKERILKQGTVSLNFMFRPEVAALLEDLESQAVFKANAVGQLRGAANALAMLTRGFASFPPIAIIAPADANDGKWKRLDEIAGNIPAYAEAMKQGGATAAPHLNGYDDAKLGEVARSLALMMDGWQKQDAGAVNAQVKQLADLLPRVAPSQYPSDFKRGVEVAYNRLYKLTLPASGLYFLAFVCFLLSARSGVSSLRLWGLRLFAVALLIHTLGIGVRWWLVAGQHGNWFDGIPIKNQFESVLFSAWFGAVVGFILELRRSRGLFGAAASFVGWLSLTAVFATPYVTGLEIGGEIGQVQGVLMSYWLYIHVTMVTASYSMIAMGFALSTWWLIAYYREHGTFSRLPLSPHQISSDAADLDEISTMSGGGAVALSPLQTLARMLFFPVRGTGLQPVSSKIKHGLPTHATEGSAFLARLDACNLVVLQLAFWVLGTGIVLGAIWADQSWGRPWGWDPKETFALVTWIVYLIVVHVRVATEHKAWWTAVLSIVGFAIMLFNWVGVNFFLVGLHSYA